jgi:hypothetical protein
MKSTTPFPHDKTYDYDADHVNGEVFSATDDLSRYGVPPSGGPAHESETFVVHHWSRAQGKSFNPL